MSYLRLERNWIDTKKLIKELGISNIRIIGLLEQEGIVYRDNFGNKLVHSQYKKELIARHMERNYIRKQDENENYNSHPQRFYTVVQLGPKGIELVKALIAKGMAA